MASLIEKKVSIQDQIQKWPEYPKFKISFFILKNFQNDYVILKFFIFQKTVDDFEMPKSLNLRWRFSGFFRISEVE